MYEGLIGTIRKAVTDPKVMELGSAMVYQEAGGFSYALCIPGEECVYKGNAFIKIVIANDESYSWLPWSEEARNNQTYLSALINDEIMEIS